MENVIAGILEIENKAKERLEEAEKMKNKIIADAKAERENMLKIKIKEAEEKLGRMDSEEKKRAEERLEEIEQSRKSEISRLDKVFNEKRSIWEDEIFAAIINR